MSNLPKIEYGLDLPGQFVGHGVQVGSGKLFKKSGSQLWQASTFNNSESLSGGWDFSSATDRARDKVPPDGLSAVVIRCFR